jgi:hypothetical protein
MAMDWSLHGTQDTNTSYNIEFVTSNGPKQMQWLVIGLMCTTPSQQTLASNKHQDCTKMVTTITAQNTIVRNFKWTKTKKIEFDGLLQLQCVQHHHNKIQ